MSRHFIKTMIAIICINLPTQADVLIHSGRADFTVAGAMFGPPAVIPS